MRNPDYFYDKVKAEYAKKNLSPLLNQAQLRLEVPMVATTQSYQFPVLTSDVVSAWGTSSQMNTETRLQQNDNFHIETICFYIALTIAQTDTNFRLQTYPNEVQWTAASANDVHNIYNGTLSINVQKQDVLLNYPMRRFYKVPQTQRLSVAANTNRDEIDLSKDGMRPASPTLMLSGKYTNIITLKLPGAITNAPASNNGRMILIFDGLTAQNASQDQQTRAAA